LSLKFKISILHVAVSFVTLFFIYMIYDSYITSQKKDIENQLMRVLKLNEQHMKKSLENIEKLLASKKDITQKIHLKIHSLLKQNPKLHLEEIRETLKKDYELEKQNLDIEIFLIDKNYLVTNSTHKKNIGLDLNLINKSKTSLDSLKKIDEYNRSKDVSVDFLDYEIKSFSYSSLPKETFLGLGVIYKDSINEKKSFDEMREIVNTNMDMFCIMKDGQNNQYYESLIAHKTKYISNEEYLRSKEKFPLELKTENSIIKTARTWKIQNKKQGDTLSIFLPMLKEVNPIMNVPGDIVLQVDLDISEQNKFLNSILYKLIIFILIHFLLVFIIFYFTNKYQKIEIKLKNQVKKNEELIEYNKHFISNLVHQIRTPLAVIMTNISLLEVMLIKNIKQYTSQINASINMLSNSYENLSYCVSFKTLSYPKRKIDLSSFIQNRIEFFDSIALANKKNIVSNIKPSIYIQMNDIELERLIDNNISNALYFSKFEGTIMVSLVEDKNKILLQFKSLNSKYIDFEVLYEKQINYRKDMSSLGLGLYLINKICEKNQIDSSFYKKDEQIVFQYEFK